MRLFIAANLPPAIRDGVYADTAPLRAASTGIRWVSSAALYVTLNFFGDPEDLLLRHAQEMVRARHHALKVTTTHVGEFPNFRRPRVVWVGMTEEKALQALV